MISSSLQHIAKVFFALTFAFIFTAKGFAMDIKDPENTLIMTVPAGDVIIQLFPDVAPNHVERLKTLTRSGFYDGVVFHRVIDGFMAQTGDPTGTGRGSSELDDLKAEFNKEPHIRGAVSMARAQHPDSANSQFFIVFDDARFLDEQYTVFGRVIDGMEHIDAIKKGDDRMNGQVDDPDSIIKMVVASDR